YYPKADYWKNLLAALKQIDTDDTQKLNIMRLQVHVKVLSKPEDFKEMAQLTLESKLACESQAVLEQGFATKAFVEKRDVDVKHAPVECRQEGSRDREGRASGGRRRIPLRRNGRCVR